MCSKVKRAIKHLNSVLRNTQLVGRIWRAALKSASRDIFCTHLNYVPKPEEPYISDLMNFTRIVTFGENHRICKRIPAYCMEKHCILENLRWHLQNAQN